ncbi:MAG: hypothetical protein KF850_06715 [Labilithrix sp.]|nr:hypothetical protein [Labilithrix sp.]
MSCASTSAVIGGNGVGVRKLLMRCDDEGRTTRTGGRSSVSAASSSTGAAGSEESGNCGSARASGLFVLLPSRDVDPL